MIYECEIKDKKKQLEFYKQLSEQNIKKLDQKDKQIELMADHIYGSDAIFYFPKEINSIEKVKQYFENLAKESN